MTTKDKRSRELERMSCIQLVTTFEQVFTEGNVIGFPLKTYAIKAILAKEFDGIVPVPPSAIYAKRELASVG